MREEPMLVFKNNKTGRELKGFLWHWRVPMIGEAVVSNTEILYRVKDVVTLTYQNRNNQASISTEIHIYLENE